MVDRPWPRRTRDALCWALWQSMAPETDGTSVAIGASSHDATQFWIRLSVKRRPQYLLSYGKSRPLLDTWTLLPITLTKGGYTRTSSAYTYTLPSNPSSPCNVLRLCGVLAYDFTLV
jgi:hypothetical protein